MPQLSQNVITFLDRNIDSAEQLEILLLLKRNPEKEWTAEEVSTELLTSVSSVGSRLADLHSRGVLSKQTRLNKPCYKYRPQTPDLNRTITDVEKAYAKYRVRIISMIYSKPIDRIRTFADAFKVKDEGDE